MLTSRTEIISVTVKYDLKVASLDPCPTCLQNLNALHFQQGFLVIGIKYSTFKFFLKDLKGLGTFEIQKNDDVTKKNFKSRPRSYM